MKRFLLIFAILAMLPFSAAGQSWPENVDPYVNDFADIIDPATEERLRGRLEELRGATGTEAVIVTLPSRKEFQPVGTLEQFGIGLINAWGVGNAEKNDGILLLVLEKDREMTIELGAGYEAAASGKARNILDNILTPAFREGAYGRGIEEGMDAIVTQIAGYSPETEAKPVPQQGSAPTADAEESRFGKWIMWAFGGLFATLIGWGIFGRKVKDRLATCPKCGKKGLNTERNVKSPATLEAQGVGEEVITCNNCDYVSRSEYPIAKLKPEPEPEAEKKEFGGGKSKGDGASGKW